MDQEKIGKFIAECRKEKKLTQEQLDQLIHILDGIRYRREMGIAKYYTEEEVHKELLQIIEEAKKRNAQL